MDPTASATPKFSCNKCAYQVSFTTKIDSMILMMPLLCMGVCSCFMFSVLFSSFFMFLFFYPSLWFFLRFCFSISPSLLICCDVLTAGLHRETKTHTTSQFLGPSSFVPPLLLYLSLFSCSVRCSCRLSDAFFCARVFSSHFVLFVSLF